MSNIPFHNKWHGFNHYTVPLSDYPDSGTDPIASENFPFLGIFYNKIPLGYKTVKQVNIVFSGFNYTRPVSYRLIQDTEFPEEVFEVIESPIFNFVLGSIENKDIARVDVVNGGRYRGKFKIVVERGEGDFNVQAPSFEIVEDEFELYSSSDHWAFYSNLTRENSGYWSKYQTTNNTVTYSGDNWFKGYTGYTFLTGNSSFYESLYNSTLSLSSEKNYTGTGGTGWHIALSSITWRTNVSAVNTHQKVAQPHQLFEDNRTITWNTTAQTAFAIITGDYTTTIQNVLNVNKGGKYTLWLYVDKCPFDNTAATFNPNVFNIQLKTSIGVSAPPLTEVVSLSRNTITKIDFTYDGEKMLGRATQYLLDAKTTDDIYYQGVGMSMIDPISRSRKTPVFVNDYNNNTSNSRYISVRSPISRPGGVNPGTKTRFNRLNDSGFNIANLTLTEYPAVTSLYVAGSGVSIKFLDSDFYYFSYLLYGATWPTQTMITRFNYLSGSFDRVIGSLSGGGDWRDYRYAENLIASPSQATAPQIIKNNLPSQYYRLQASNLISVSSCTRFYNISVISGKDRQIDSINVNNVSISKNPITYNGYPQQYNFLNEESCVLSFEKIQDDYDIRVFFKNQAGKFTRNGYMWLNPGDNTLIRDTTLPTPGNLTQNLGKLYSNFEETEDIFISGPAPSTSPQLNLEKSYRYLNFIPGRYATSSVGLTGLSGTDYFRDFTVYTVFEIKQANASNIPIWWIGNYQDNNGYGLELQTGGTAIYTRYNKIRAPIITGLQFNKIYVLANMVYRDGNSIREAAFLDDKRVIRPTTLSRGSSFNNLNLYFNRYPENTNSHGYFRIYEFYIHRRQLTASDLKRMNLFLLDKYSKYKL